MRFIGLVTSVLVAALAGTATAAPADPKDVSVIPEDVLEQMREGMATEPRDCTRQGATGCVLSIMSLGGGGGSYRFVGVWDSNCASLGYTEINAPGDGTFEFNVNLPHPIRLEIRGDNIQPEGDFFYNGARYDIGWGTRHNCYDDLPGTECVRTAFTCR